MIHDRLQLLAADGLLALALTACSSDSVHMPALLADPMADYKTPGIILVDAWEQPQHPREPLRVLTIFGWTERPGRQPHPQIRALPQHDDRPYAPYAPLPDIRLSRIEEEVDERDHGVLSVGVRGDVLPGEFKKASPSVARERVEGAHPWCGGHVTLNELLEVRDPGRYDELADGDGLESRLVGEAAKPGGVAEPKAD